MATAATDDPIPGMSRPVPTEPPGVEPAEPAHDAHPRELTEVEHRGILRLFDLLETACQAMALDFEDAATMPRLFERLLARQVTQVVQELGLDEAAAGGLRDLALDMLQVNKIPIRDVLAGKASKT